MQTERDKENTIRNSKLQMSIKPFNVLREDLSKSKSVDKARKGISRVNSVAASSGHGLAGHTSSENFYSSMAALHPYTNIQVTTFSQNHNPVPKLQENNKKSQSELLCKVELLQKQLVVVEQENIQVLRERNQWKDKCGELSEVNSRLQIKVQEMHERVNQVTYNLRQVEEQSRKKQQQLNEIIMRNQTGQENAEQSNEHLRQLNKQLMEAKHKIVQLQKQLDMQRMKEEKGLEEVKWSAKEMRLLKEEKLQLEESYRQLLIKSSTSSNQVLQLQGKIRSLSHQLCCEQEQNAKMEQNYRKLEQGLDILEEEAVLGRACRKQLEEIDHIKLVNADLLRQNKQYELRMRELEQKRLNQIQFHQEEIRRICANEIGKYENLIETYKKQRDEAQKQIQNVKNFYHKEERNQKILIDSINTDYESIVAELKDKLTNLATQKQQLQISNKEYQVKKTEVNELVEKLRAVKEDNAFLLLKLEEQMTKNKTTTQFQTLRRSRERTDSQAQASLKEVVNSLRNQIKQLQQSNRLAERKLSEYEVQLMKLSDKVQIYQIDAENAKGRQTSLQRKIKHLVEEVEHLQEDKGREITEKFKLMEDLQNTKLCLKNKDIEYRTMEQALVQSTTKLEVLQVKLASTEHILNTCQQQLQEKSIKLNQLGPQLEIMKQELGLTKSNMQQLTGFYQSTINSLNQQLEKEKHSRKLSHDQNNEIQEKLQQKLRAKYSTHQQQIHAKETRFSIYRHLLADLGVDSDIKSLDQIDTLNLLGKALRVLVDKKLELEIRIGKIEVQYRESLQTENATRMLAQKYQEKCVELENLLIRMEQAHKEKLVLVKQDYDIVYGKYMKYRNMVILQNKERSKEKGLRR